jgi:hypothetical protein
MERGLGAISCPKGSLACCIRESAIYRCLEAILASQEGTTAIVVGGHQEKPHLLIRDNYE